MEFPEGEFSRSIEVIADVQTGRKRAGMAGTQYIDRRWRSIQEEIPTGGISCQTASGRERMSLYIRSGQWKTFYGTEDKWPHFCRAMTQWLARHRGDALAKAAQVAAGLSTAAVAQARRRLRRKTPDATPAASAAMLVAPQGKPLPPSGSVTTLGSLASPAASGRRPRVLPPLPDGLHCERQGTGSVTCAVHATNHILQGPVFAIADFVRIQAETAADLHEGLETHGNISSVSPGDWSIEVIGHALRSRGHGMRWYSVRNKADCLRVLSGCKGFLIGTGVHWTAVVKRDDLVIHFDSLVHPNQPVAAVVPDLGFLSRKAVFRVLENDAGDSFEDEAQRARVALRFQQDWKCSHPALAVLPNVSSA